MKSTTLFAQVTADLFRLEADGERFEATLERQASGRLTDDCRQKLEQGLRDFSNRAGKFSRVKCALNARGVSLRRLKLPVAAPDETRRLLTLQIENEFPLPPEQLAWGSQRAAAHDLSQQEMIVAAVKRELVLDYAELFSTLDLETTFTLSAMERVRLVDDPPATFAMIEIGDTHSEFLNVESGVPVALRIVPWGIETVIRAVGANLGVGMEEASRRFHDDQPDAEIVRAIGEAVTTVGPLVQPAADQTLFVTGTVLLNQTIVAAIEKRWALGRCEVLKPDPGSMSPTVAAMKLGEALGASKSFILEMGDTQKRRPAIASGQGAKWGIALVALALALLAAPYAEALLLKDRVARKLAEARNQSASLSVIDQEYAFLQDLKKSHAPYLDTLYLLANSAPAGARFDSVSVNRRGEIALKGNMANAQQVTEFRSKLIGSGFFASVVVDEQNPTPDRQKVAVRISAQWHQGSARKPVTVAASKPAISNSAPNDPAVSPKATNSATTNAASPKTK